MGVVEDNVVVVVVAYGNLWWVVMMTVDGGVRFNLVGIVLVAMVQIGMALTA